MGGFYCYVDGRPTKHLSFHEVNELVTKRSLVPPTSKEIQDKSKSDALSKTIAVVQTLWFVVQCITRSIQGLAITELEIMTLAYTVITVAMYAVWWHKPRNIGCPTRVLRPSPRDAPSSRPDSIISSSHDDERGYMAQIITSARQFSLSSYRTDFTKERIPHNAGLIALSFATAFGAIHCAAWSNSFPTFMEGGLWRMCSAIISVVPVLAAFIFIISENGLVVALGNEGQYNGSIASLTFVTCMYISCRIILFVLAFTTLRSLPPTVYQSVQWINMIPHISS